MDTTGAFFESDEDDHTSLMQTSMDKGDEESLMQMQTKLKKRSQAVMDDSCLEEADHASMMQHHDVASKVRVRSRKDAWDSMDTTGAFFESDEDDHTSLMQTSMDKGDEESLMQMQTKLKKRSKAVMDDSCLDEADHASMMQHHDVASNVRVRSRKDAHMEVSGAVFESDEDDHMSLIQISVD